MTQEDILKLLTKHKGQKFDCNQIATLLNQTKNNTSIKLKKIRKWKLAKYDTIKVFGTIPFYKYWR